MTDNNRAHNLMAQGQLKEAETLYRQALAANPNDGDAYWGLGRIAMSVNYYEAAIEMLKQSVKLLPRSPVPLIHLADAYNLLRNFDDAGKCYQQAAQLAPQYPLATYSYGEHLSALGETKKAEQLYRTTLKSDPSFIYAFSSLARIKAFHSKNDKDIKAMEALLKQPELSKQNQMPLRYALGKAYYDIADKELAMKHLIKANAIQKQSVTFSVAELKPFFQSIKDTFNQTMMASSGTIAEGSATPIFIISQPRSGSTLLELMLGAHSSITGAGELPFIGREVASAINKMTGQHFPQACLALSPDQLTELGNIYLKAATANIPDCPYFIDKMPANFQSIGLIKKILPHAKIINLRRHPMDVGFSIFRNFFNENEPNFCSLSEIGKYHLLYEDLMKHWHQLLPDTILDVHYEHLVQNPKAVVTEVLKFCDLNWQQSCLEYNKHRGHTQTLSDAQVTAEIHSQSINSWKTYQNELEDLQLALGTSIDNYEPFSYNPSL